MSSISKYIKDINKEASNRTKEITYMFSTLSKYTNAVDKFFFARTVVVFTYGTLEKFIKSLSEIALKIALDNNYFNQNYVQELMQILKYNKKPKKLFDLLMHNKNVFISRNNFETIHDQGYFSRNSRIDAATIAHIINVLNLNKNSLNIKIPKVTINAFALNRMSLAHGDYINELNRFNPNRENINIIEVNKYINDEYKLNDISRSEILEFIDDFKNKIISFLEEIELFEKTKKL